MIDTVKLKKLRKEMKLRQWDVAKRSNITGGYYSEIENGNRAPSLETTIAIAKALGVTPNDILPDEVINPPQPPTPDEQIQPPGTGALLPEAETNSAA